MHDHSSTEQLYRDHHDRLLRLLRRDIGGASADELEDALQTVWLELTRRPRRIDPDRAGAYLYVSARRAAVAILNKRTATGGGADALAIARDDQARDEHELITLIRELPERQARAVMRQAVGYTTVKQSGAEQRAMTAGRATLQAQLNL